MLSAFPVRGESFSPVMMRDNPAFLADQGLEWEAGFRMSAFAGERIVPLKDFFGEWEEPIHIEDRNLAHSRSMAEFFAVRAGWEISLGARQELTLFGNRDGVEAVSLLRSKQDLPVGNRYQVELEGTGYVAEELRLAKGWRPSWFPGLSFGAAVGLLHGERIQNGTLAGPLTITGKRTYDYAMTLNYNYDINYLYDFNAGRSGMDGWGHSLDLGVRYQRDGWDLSLYAEDLFSRIYWSGVPTTNATANNGSIHIDSDGFVHYDPIVTGFEGKTNPTQYLEEKVSGAIQHTWERVRISAGTAWMKDTFFPNVALGGRRSETAGWWSLGYDVYFRMVGVEYEGRHGRLSVYSDSLNPDSVGAVGFRASIFW